MKNRDTFFVLKPTDYLRAGLPDWKLFEAVAFRTGNHDAMGTLPKKIEDWSVVAPGIRKGLLLVFRPEDQSFLRLVMKSRARKEKTHHPRAIAFRSTSWEELCAPQPIPGRRKTRMLPSEARQFRIDKQKRGSLMKVSRNDQCPCGSGKKYKKCCLAEAQAQDFSYRRISQTFQSLTGKLMSFAEKTLGQATIEVAIEEFLVWDEDFEATISLEELSDLFVPWALYAWYLTEPDIEDLEVEIPLPADTTITELYIQKKAKKIDSLELKILQAIKRPMFSFYEVTRVLPGSGFSCTDILTGGTHNVTDHSASGILETGDIFFCAISRVDDIEMLIGASPIKFPLSWKTDVIDLRTSMKEDQPELSEEDMLEYDATIRELFLAMYAAALNPPALTNTDGDPLAVQTLYYSIPNAQEAFDALCHLCATESREKLLEKATFAESGGLAVATIPWTRLEASKAAPLPDTVLGDIFIDEDTMTIEVNSENRAQTIRDIITTAMGDRARPKPPY